MPLIRVPDAAGKTLLLTEYGTSPKYLGPCDCLDTQLEDVHNIPIREDDIILLSYPKSGSHWLWEMTRMLRAGTPHVDTVEKDKYMMEYTPREQLDDLPSPRTLNTHYLFHQLPPKVQEGKVKLVFIYRNPKDVAVSFYNHHFKFPEYEYTGQFSDYLRGLFLKDQVDFGDFFTYTRDWEAVMDSRQDLSVFTVSYEELQSYTIGKIKELARFLESTADDATIQDIVDKCSFSNMREQKGKKLTELYGEPVLYRKGKVGDWKTWFTVAESDLMDAVCHEKMRGSRFQFKYEL